MNNCFFISEGAFTFKVEGTGVITRGFFVSGGSEVIIVVSINEINNKFSLMLTTIITSLPPLTKNPLVITPVPSTLKVNAPSDIKKQLFII